MARTKDQSERKIDNLRVMMPLDLKSKYKARCATIGIDMSEPVREFVERFVSKETKA